jgi:hypothetical protein
MTEAMDMDGRLDQLVRAGLMPTSSLPLLKRAISRMHAGMSLQGAERDVMNMFISSMMFIVLGDDTVFNKARAGAKTYATEADSKQHIEVTHITGQKSKKPVHPDNAFKALNHYKSLSTTKSARIVSEAKEKTEYDYEGDMAMGQLKSIIANSQRMHDMLSDDTNLPEWVQSKITLAEDYISTASNYMQGEMNEEKDMPFDGPYRKVGERKDKYGNTIKNAAKHLAKKAMNAQTQKNEEVQIDELSKKTMGSYIKKASGAEKPKNVMDPKNVPLTKIAAYQGDSETGHFGKRFNQATYDKAERLHKNRSQGITRAADKLAKEEVEITEASVADVAKTAHLHVRAGKHDSIHTAIQSAVNTHFPSSVHSSVTRKKVAAQALNRIQSMNKSKMTKEEVEQVDEISKATMGRYINKAKDSIDMTSYRSGIKDGTAISSSTPYKSNNPLEKKLTKRHKGIETAVKKLTKEESEQIDELSKATLKSYGNKASDQVRDYVTDKPTSFKASMNNMKREKGLQSLQKRKTNEESEQIDELSKKTLGSYVNKAAERIGTKGVSAGLRIAADEKSSGNFKDMGKRQKGISRAVNKLTKEDIDAVKQMNESYKTAFETALNEYGIKSPSELDESKRKEFFNHVDLEFKKGDN